MENDLTWNAIWTDHTKTSFTFKNNSNEVNTFSRGTWLRLPGRDDKVMIDNIIQPYYSESEKNYLLTTYKYNKQNIDNIEKGPIGITYLPWRYDENRFAKVLYNIRGNQRFIICYPTGINNCGIHINWDIVKITTPPDNINEDMVNEILKNPFTRDILY